MASFQVSGKTSFVSGCVKSLQVVGLHSRFLQHISDQAFQGSTIASASESFFDKDLNSVCLEILSSLFILGKLTSATLMRVCI